MAYIRRTCKTAFLLLISTLAFPQKDVEADSAVYYIERGKQALQSYYDEALSYTLQLNPEESIFSEDSGYVGLPEHPVIDAVALDSIDDYWLRANEMSQDPAIDFALCRLYANGIDTEKLFHQIAQMKSAYGHDPELPYHLANYAEGLIARQAEKEAVLLYKKLIHLFPEAKGLYNDLAGTYFLIGNMEKAELMADSALALNTAEPTLRNAFFIFGINEKDEKVRQVAQKITEMKGTPEGPLITALQKVLQKAPGWRTSLEKIGENDSKGSDALAELIQTLIEENFQWAYDDYMSLRQLPLGDVYRLYLHRIFHDRFPEQTAPLYYYGELMSYYKRYEKACRLFALQPKLPEDHPYFTRYNYTFAWSLYAADKQEKAKQKWLLLNKNDDYRIATAAAYFLAKTYVAENKKSRAKELLLDAKPYFNETKYGRYCMNLYHREF